MIGHAWCLKFTIALLQLLCNMICRAVLVPAAVLAVASLAEEGEEVW